MVELNNKAKDDMQNIRALCRMIIDKTTEIQISGLDTFQNPELASLRRLTLELYKQSKVFKKDVSELTR